MCIGREEVRAHGYHGATRNCSEVHDNDDDHDNQDDHDDDAHDNHDDRCDEDGGDERRPPRRR